MSNSPPSPRSSSPPPPLPYTRLRPCRPPLDQVFRCCHRCLINRVSQRPAAAAVAAEDREDEEMLFEDEERHVNQM